MFDDTKECIYLKHPTTQKVCAFIQAYKAANGYAPSIRDIADGCRIGTTTVFYQLGKLERHGLLTRDSGVARSIRLTPSGQNAVNALSRAS